MRPIIRRPLAAGAALFVLLGTAGCVQTFDARTLGSRTTLSSAPAAQPQGEAFVVNKTAVFVFWGLGTASRPLLDRVLAGQLTGEAEVTNLRVTVRSRFSDVLVTALTAGLIIPRTITYEGTIVRPGASAPPSTN